MIGIITNIFGYIENIFEQMFGGAEKLHMQKFFAKF